MDVLDAAYNTVHNYAGGADSLAPRIGVSSGQMLRNKVNPSQEQNHLSLAEAARIVGITGDKSIPDAFACMVGCVLIPLVEFSEVSDMALLETYTKLMKELGDFSQEFHQTLSDGRITQSEIGRLDQHMREFQAAGAELLNRARQLVEPESK